MTAALVPVLAGVLVGCGSGQPQACTMVGMDSGVGVGWKTDAFAVFGPVEYRLCAGDHCVTRRTGDGDVPMIQVVLAQDVGPQKLAVHFTVTQIGGGKPVMDVTRDVRLAEQHPNGKGCDPTAWRAGFTAVPGKGLVG